MGLKCPFRTSTGARHPKHDEETGRTMNWKRRVRRNLLVALLGGVAANAIYFGLLFTTALHGFAVGALGPAINLVNRYVDPTYSARSYRFLEEFAMNIALGRLLVSASK